MSEEAFCGGRAAAQSREPGRKPLVLRPCFHCMLSEKRLHNGVVSFLRKALELSFEALLRSDRVLKISFDYVNTRLGHVPSPSPFTDVRLPPFYKIEPAATLFPGK